MRSLAADSEGKILSVGRNLYSFLCALRIPRRIMHCTDV